MFIGKNLKSLALPLPVVALSYTGMSDQPDTYSDTSATLQDILCDLGGSTDSGVRSAGWNNPAKTRIGDFTPNRGKVLETEKNTKNSNCDKKVFFFSSVDDR